MNPLFSFYFKMNKYLYIHNYCLFIKNRRNKGNIYAL